MNSQWVSAVAWIVAANRLPEKYPVCVVAIRGAAGRENRAATYDDTLAIVWPDGVAVFSGNMDPSGPRRPDGATTYLVQPGIYLMGDGIDIFARQRVFRQAGPVTYKMWGGSRAATGFCQWQWHGGGARCDTRSYGCFTSPPKEWKTASAMLRRLLDEYRSPMGHDDAGIYDPTREKVRTFPILVTDASWVRDGNLELSNRQI